MTTPFFICGAECRVNVGGVLADGNEHWDTFGAATVETTNIDALGGSAAWKFATAGAAISRTYPASKATVVSRLRVRLESTYDGIVAYFPGNGAGLAGLASFTGGVLKYSFDLSSWTTIATLSTGVYHTLDISVGSASNTTTLKVAIDGGATNTYTASQSTDTWNSATIGDPGVLYTTGTMYVDGILLSTTSADFPIGSGYVIGYAPQTTSGTHNQTAGDLKNNTPANITNGDSSGGLVDEVPANTTDYVAQVVLRTTTYWEGIYATSGATAMPIGVEQIVSFFMASAASGSHKAQLYDGTTATDAYATAGHTNNTIANKTKCWASAPSGTWTTALLKTTRIRFGFSGDVTPNPRLSSTMLEVAYGRPATSQGYVTIS